MAFLLVLPWVAIGAVGGYKRRPGLTCVCLCALNVAGYIFAYIDNQDTKRRNLQRPGGLNPFDDWWTFMQYVTVVALVAATLVAFVFYALGSHVGRIATESHIRECKKCGMCPKCGYDLRSVFEPRCPECGAGFAQGTRCLYCNQPMRQNKLRTCGACSKAIAARLFR